MMRERFEFVSFCEPEYHMKKVKYLLTQHYDDDEATATLLDKEPKDIKRDNCDSYVEAIGDGGDYATLEDWIEQLCIELDDIIPLVLDLDAGKAVDISAYC